ncbi:hypothetical protein BJ508DRAFT_372288 [Ascobolus immersus RN42]|uniref:F-box domain-containing protein n=1 Tax=Ascobolus immersus RN42 TaxID=1160509 RepID=A0A3N4IM44_ASCIM|nr:hypothetical protein BJ508DRAFT_372288 [Ascobolus immersus RN42]
MEAVFLRSFDAREREKKEIFRLYAGRELRKKLQEQQKSPEFGASLEKIDKFDKQDPDAHKQSYDAVQSLVAEVTAIDKPVGERICWLPGPNGKKHEVKVSLNDLIMDRADMEQDALDPTDFAKHIPLDNELFIPVRNANREASWGILASFPNEIIDNFLLVADIQTLTTLRGVNTHIRNWISETPEYRDVYEHGIGALRAMLATGAARYHSIRKLHSQLRSFACSHCLEYREPNDSHIECGNLLYLHTCERYCYDCCDWLWKNRESVVNEEKALEYLGIVDSATLEGLPYITYRSGMVPRDASQNFEVCNLRGQKFYMQKEVTEAVVRRFGQQHMDETLLNIYVRELARPFPHRDRNEAFRTLLQTTGCSMRWLDRASQFFFVGLPAVQNPRLGLADWGSVCKGCFSTRFERDIWHPNCVDPEPAPLLASSDMLKHLETCRFAAELRRATMDPSHEKHVFYSIIVREKYPSEPWRKGFYQEYLPSFHHEWDDDVDDSEEEDDIDDVPDDIGQANDIPEFPQAVLDNFALLLVEDPDHGPEFNFVDPALATDQLMGSNEEASFYFQIPDGVPHQHIYSAATSTITQYSNLSS